MRILRKRPRESTDLEEYIILEPKNFFQLQKLMKLWRAPIGEKRELVGFFLQKHAGSSLEPNIRFARFDYTGPAGVRSQLPVVLTAAQCPPRPVRGRGPLCG